MKRIISDIAHEEAYNEKQENQLNTKRYEIKIVWSQVAYIVFFHVTALYGIYLCFTSTCWKTIFFALALWRITISIGLLAIHRFWSHRAFKAKLPLQIFMCIFTFALGQGSIFSWCRDHRVHHKYVDTSADPYNIKRGFFFAHIGWLMCRKHPDVLESGNKLPMDDLRADPVVRFNRKYYHPMWILFCFILPTIIPVYFWEEKWVDAYCVAAVLKYMLQLHSVFCINSVAHMYGYRPFDKKIEARESFFAESVQPGEGSHNYHHAFPRDYRTKELIFSLSFSRFFVDFMAAIGQAYDLKLSSDDLIKVRKLKSGDRSK
ncbi:acyl-CoA Delta(11) desaturase-like isoform X1 [Argiope bruennichi]|uniref:acyl-CoA Delta(11) desaturase-like isoform X1 n=1 Tax=Argiope bruennichi TaxID=94029 RepID=UPI0024943CEB|nr:acyl-CoA Delta(11) desaturase-like isoform X1 [Argiope bruennichi]